MLNPFVLAMLARMRQQQQQPFGSTAMDFPYENQNFGAQPWDTAVVPGAMSPDPGFDREAAERDARRQGLGALGIALLKGAPTGDYAGALAEGFAGMAETRHRLMQEAEQRERQRQQDERLAAADVRQQQELEDRLLTTGQNREITAKTFEEQQEEWKEEESKRAGIARAAADLSLAIAKIAGPDSPEAVEAATQAARGVDADLGRLQAIRDAAVDRSRRAEDYQFKTQQEIQAERERAKAGYGEIPQARRAEESLAIQRQYAALNGAGGKAPTAAQRHDDIEREIDRLTAPSIARRQQYFGDVSPEFIAQERAKARAAAEATVDSIYARELGGGPEISRQPGPERGGPADRILSAAATKKLAGVKDPGLIQKIQAARRAGYSDSEIASFLGIH